MSSVCWYTRLTIPVSGGGAPYYSWPSNTTCTPSEGLCYTSATVVGGGTTLEAGCWPAVATQRELAYIGAQASSSLLQLIS